MAASHFGDLLGGLNALRAANGWGLTTWTAILPPGVPPPMIGGLVYATHARILREQIDLALQGLSVAAPPFADPDLALGVPIRAIHIEQLRGRTQ